MRYAPAERVLRLALRLAGSRTGLTLDEMAADLEIGRRTAERLRDSLLLLFPQMEHTDDELRVRRWRLPVTALAGLAEPRAEAIAAVDGAAREAAARGDADRAALLRDAAATLRALMPAASLRRAEPDIAALLEAEGLAMRPGPRVRVAAGVLPTLRRAILASQVVTLHYRPAYADAPLQRAVCPYGILYGGRGWLLAHVEDLPELRLWRLDRIASAELCERAYRRDPDFDLSAYAARSFGVFQEEPVDVVLRFAPEAAEQAADWLFHPTQAMRREADGGMIVSFYCGGMQEMCWHLFRWGSTVRVIAPSSMQKMISLLASELADHHTEITKG
jgi:predicted DNA-binding transcriptional regulator YafY